MKRKKLTAAERAAAPDELTAGAADAGVELIPAAPKARYNGQAAPADKPAKVRKARKARKAVGPSPDLGPAFAALNEAQARIENYPVEAARADAVKARKAKAAKADKLATVQAGGLTVGFTVPADDAVPEVLKAGGQVVDLGDALATVNAVEAKPVELTAAEAKAAGVVKGLLTKKHVGGYHPKLPRVTLTVEVEPETVANLERIEKRTGRDRASVIGYCIRKVLLWGNNDEID